MINQTQATTSPNIHLSSSHLEKGQGTAFEQTEDKSFAFKKLNTTETNSNSSSLIGLANISAMKSATTTSTVRNETCNLELIKEEPKLNRATALNDSAGLQRAKKILGRASIPQWMTQRLDPHNLSAQMDRSGEIKPS